MAQPKRARQKSNRQAARAAQARRARQQRIMRTVAILVVIGLIVGVSSILIFATRSSTTTSSTTSTTLPPTTTTTVPATTTSPPPIPAALSQKPVVTRAADAATTTKLEVKDLVDGNGPAVTGPTQTVTVNYVGVLAADGTEFDSSWSHGQTFTTALNAVIPGWTQGIPGMKVGGRRMITIPAALGYGASGSPPKIPANANLVFVVDLLAVK